MKKYTRVFFSGLALLAFNTASFAADGAVKVSIGSDGSGNVSANVATIRQIIGHAVGGGVVDKFIVDNGTSPVEGGLIACAEAGAGIISQDSSQLPGSIDKFTQLVNQLGSIQADPGIFINIQPAEKCGIEAGSGVSCAQDAQQCPDGSYVSRQPPSCEFSPCPEQIPEE